MEQVNDWSGNSTQQSSFPSCFSDCLKPFCSHFSSPEGNTKHHCLSKCHGLKRDATLLFIKLSGKKTFKNVFFPSSFQWYLTLVEPGDRCLPRITCERFVVGFCFFFFHTFTNIHPKWMLKTKHFHKKIHLSSCQVDVWQWLNTVHPSTLELHGGTAPNSWSSRNGSVPKAFQEASDHSGFFAL